MGVMEIADSVLFAICCIGIVICTIGLAIIKHNEEKED